MGQLCFVYLNYVQEIKSLSDYEQFMYQLCCLYTWIMYKKWIFWSYSIHNLKFIERLLTVYVSNMKFCRSDYGLIRISKSHIWSGYYNGWWFMDWLWFKFHGYDRNVFLFLKLCLSDLDYELIITSIA